MAQHDYNIANASFPTVRTDINNVLSAINTCNSGSSRPSGAVAGTIWLDTSGAATAHLLNFYDGAADILLATINTTANTVDWSDSSVDGVTFKEGGTNFTNSLLVGHATTGTLSSADGNTGVGIGALDALTSGDNNLATGKDAGTSITTSSNNTLVGGEAGFSVNTATGHNTYVGNAAGYSSAGSYNTGVGARALIGAAGSETGNCAFGYDSLVAVTSGGYNLGIGYGAGNNITTGSGNVIIGFETAPSATDSQQLKITGNNGASSVEWITGDSSGNVTVAGTLTSTTGLVKTVGKESIWIPSNSMTPSTTNGAERASVETTATRPDMQVLDFDTTTKQYAQFSVAFPKSWNLGTVTFQAFWSGIAATTDVDWGVQAVAMNDNETIDIAFGTGVVVTDNAQGAVEELLVTAESGAITIAGTPADNDLTYFQIYRDVSGDAMAGDARLHGVKVFYTTDAANDA